jgi:hypothetical protein
MIITFYGIRFTSPYHHFCYRVATNPVGQGLIIVKDSWSHSITPHSVGLLWMSDQPDAETSTWQYTTLATPYPRQDSNPYSQQASGRRPTPYNAQPLGSAHTIDNVISSPIINGSLNYVLPNVYCYGEGLLLTWYYGAMLFIIYQPTSVVFPLTAAILLLFLL